MEIPNPPVTRLLRGVTVFEAALLLVSGGGLFFLPSLLEPIWLWELTPFNARFLGGIYLALTVAAAALAVIGRWSPARIVVPMVFIFTAITLAISLFYNNRLNGNLFSVVLWFALYITLPVVSFLHMRLYQTRKPVPGIRLPKWMINLLRAQVIVLGGYGLALLAIPELAGDLFPWALDEFHARLYSTAFITPAVGAFLLWSAHRYELIALGLTQIVGGVFPIIGLFVVDATVQRVNWSAAGTWVWIALFAYIFIMGVLLLAQIRPLRSAK